MPVMVEPATRVALLARPGTACDNLQAALRQAGADVVAVQDPTSGDPAAVSAARPSALLVALEPAVEDALGRYDAVLSEPGRLVIYDEVAIAAKREGWDAARWARHLAAKLGGHGDVLPPGAGSDDGEPDYTRTIAAKPSFRQPVSAAPPESAREPEPEPQLQAEPKLQPESQLQAQQEPAGAMELESMEFDADAVHLGIESSQEEAIAQAGTGIDFGGFTPEMMAAMTGETASAPLPAPEAVRDFAPPPAPADEGLSLEWDAPIPAAAPQATVPASPPEPQAAPAPARFTASEMSLVDIEPDTGTGSAGFGAFTTEGGEGGVVVLAGIGGPDAVRQFLVGLPAGFARPIIVRQRLDGGRHDRLVRQMQRATALPVELAESGRTLVSGHVYILPDGMTTTAGNGATTFVATDAPVPVLAGLPASDSAVLVLSGSDPAVLPELLDAAREGAIVAGQSPEESFDGAAATALAAAGGESHTAAALAQRLSRRWLSLKD
jgi:chemosensory pili system protein ChpB (putative protein-glutamate methylesterase)